MNNLLQFSAAVEIQAAGGDAKRPPRISVLAYAGGEMSVGGFGPVAVDLAGATIDGNIPILAGHQDDLDSVVGQGQATIRSNQLYLEGTLTDATASGQKVLALHKSGITLQASIGFMPDRREQIAPGKNVIINNRTLTAGKNGLTVVRSGRLREVSLLPIGADAGTQVSIAASLNQKGKLKMSEELFAGKTREEINAEMKAMLPENQPGITQMERVQARWDRTRWHSEGNPKSSAQKAMISCAAGKISFEQFENELLQAQLNDSELQLIHAKMPKASAVYGSTHDMPGGDEKTLLQAAATLHLAGDGATEKIYGAHVAEGARRLGVRSIVGLCEAGLRMRGELVPSNTHELLKAGFSTVNLPGILGDSANKLLLNEFQQLPSIARMVCRKLSASDFKTTTGYRLGANATMEEVGDAGEIKHGTLDQSSFTYKLATYGKMFALTRQTIINDDMSAFAQLPRIIARGGLMALENCWATLLLSNPGSFFSAGNGNYIDGADTVLNETSLTEALGLFRSATDDNGDPIMVSPKYLLTPPELEIVSRRIMNATDIVATGDTNATVPNNNPFYKLAEPLVSPHLSNANITGNSSTGWYLFGNPNDVAAMGIGYLDNMEAPTFETADSDFNTLGMQFRGFFDFAVCMAEHAGAVKSKGSA